MATTSATRINSALTKFYSNGVPQVGLEVGTDAGLSPDEYIRIPRSMVKRWVYRTPGAAVYDRKDTDKVDNLIGKPGWTLPDAAKFRLVRVDDQWYVRDITTTDALGKQIDDFYVDSADYDDLRRFIVANIGHIRDDKIDVKHAWWVHSVRFWGTISGLVAGSKNKEYTVVDNPTGDLDQANEFADQIIDFCEPSLTAASARGVSWRKSSHATGGNICGGFPKRWLQQHNWWPSGNPTKEATVKQQMEVMTTTFYVATHAIAVHNVLAVMAGEDEGHWAEIDPRFGCTYKWDIMVSTKIRMAPKTQIAGAAMVVDAAVVLRMLVKARIVPLLENVDQHAALAALLKTVETYGVRAAVYAQWFLDGHPKGLTKVEFNQKDPACADLIGELGAVAVHFFKDTTIGQSPALQNAAKQLASNTSVTQWTALGKKKTAAAPEMIQSVYNKIVGASGPADIVALDSNDVDSVRTAVVSANETVRRIAEAFGISNAPEIKADDMLRTSDPAGSGEV